MSDSPRVFLATNQHFPFEDAVLLEDCAWHDPVCMREECVQDDVALFVARGIRPRLHSIMPESSFLLHDLGYPSTKGDSLVGFLSALQENRGDREVSTLLNIAVSSLEDAPMVIDDLLVFAWQEECRRRYWSYLEVDLRQDDPAESLLLRHRFRSVRLPHRQIPVMIWEP